MPYSITTQPDWIVDQVVAVAEINVLLANDAAMWDLFGADHDARTAEHRGFLFPEAMGRAVCVAEDPITLTGTTFNATAGGTTVTVSTADGAFTTELDVGDQIVLDGEAQVVAYITDDNNLTIADGSGWATAHNPATTASGRRLMDKPYYYWTPMSYGFAGDPVREYIGVVRCPLLWRTVAVEGADIGGIKRTAQCFHDDVAWNGRLNTPGAYWRIATCDTLGTDGDWQIGARVDDVLVLLNFQDASANWTLLDEPFQLIVWQNFE